MIRMQVPDLDIDPHMTYGDLRRYADGLDVTVSSEYLPKGLTGFYVDSIRTIIIDRAVSYTQKRCTLVHELVHWIHRDDLNAGVLGSRMENRTKRKTAALMVSPIEYAMAEEEYDSDIFRIAAELDVTRQVIEDYRRLVLSPSMHR